MFFSVKPHQERRNWEGGAGWPGVRKKLRLGTAATGNGKTAEPEIVIRK